MRQLILNLHGLGTPDRRTLETGEDKYWVNPQIFKDTVALAQDLRDQVNVSFTFDDGNQSDHMIAAPILERAGLTAIFFMLADRIDQPGSLSTADLCDLVSAGHQIGTHGAAHVNWKTADLTHELGAQTRQKIATAAGQDITAAAIPFGAYNRHVIRALARENYTHCYSSDGGPCRSSHHPIPRTSLRADMTMDDIADIIHGREPVKTRLRRVVAMRLKKRL